MDESRKLDLPLWRDGLISNTTLSWPWWVRPWMALKILFGWNVHVQVRTATENVIGRSKATRTSVWDWCSWWPTPGPVGVKVEEDDRRG